MTERLEDIAIALVAAGKGILAADESSGTIIPVFTAILDGVSKKIRGYVPNPSGMNMGYRVAESIWRA